MTALAWTVTATLWAGILALAGIWVLNRAFARRHRRTAVAREPKELPSTATTAARSVLSLVRRLVQRHRPVPAPGAHHEGATENFGAELHALRDAPLSPELRPVLTEVAMRADLHQQLDVLMADFRFDLDHILDGVCRRLDPLWARVDHPTGEYAVVTA